jgi:hypothetical protein
MIVRNMQPQEIDVTVNLFNYYKMEAVESIPSIEEEYDVDSVLETIRMYNTYNEYIWFNAYEGQRPVGLISGCITAVPWNRKILMAHIDMIFLLPSHRNMSNVKMLYDAFETWAMNCGCSKITGGDIGIFPERTEKIYSHLGFKPGVFMVKELSE